MGPTPQQVTERVSRVRRLMAEAGVDALIVGSSDRYLNEYVPPGESTRIWLSGFTGSAGEALITAEEAWIAVDGRYYLQADTQAEGTPYTVERVPLGTSISDAIGLLVKSCAVKGTKRIGYAPDRITVRALERLEKLLEDASVELVGLEPSLVERARGEIDEPRNPIRGVDDAAVGGTIAEKVAAARPHLEEADVQAFVVQPLDALAWLTNLRGQDLPYQATYRGFGLLTRDAVVVEVDADRIDAEIREARKGALRLIPPGTWSSQLEHGWRVGYDPATTTAHVVRTLETAGALPVSMPSPVSTLKAKKTSGELEAMRAAFAKADAVVTQATAFVRDRLDEGERVTEKDLADAVARLFEESGAVGLSFKVIAAAGENGAIIHYSDPDPEREIRPEELVLLDTGGYYVEGYATDLTRTFLAGSPAKVPGATDEQRRIFTLVLKAAIAGMSARFPVGTRGDQLDAIVRTPLWAEGMDFNHGTGHGVGVNVHEAPPRVSTKGASPLEVGHVFSIEPGLYVPGFGGVRIENLCTIAESEVAPGFLDAVPLTFAPLDRRLIDQGLLSPREQAWLEDYLNRCEAEA